MNRIELNNRKRPFSTPENYFEDFHRKLMDELPEKGTPARRYIALSTMKRWSAAAAITLMLLVSATALLQYSTAQHNTTPEFTETERNEYIESIFDNCLIDEYNVYSYLTSYDTNY